MIESFVATFVFSMQLLLHIFFLNKCNGLLKQTLVLCKHNITQLIHFEIACGNKPLRKWIPEISSIIDIYEHDVFISFT